MPPKPPMPGFTTGEPMPHGLRGFTLIELAVVLFLVALLMGALLGPVTLRIEAEQRAQVEAYLAEVKQALIGFALRHGRLPCPDSSGGDGRENRTLPSCTGGWAGAQCDSGAGPLPHTDLGVAQTDPWGQRPYYFVSRVLVTSRRECPENVDIAVLRQIFSLEAGAVAGDFIDIETRDGNRVLQKVAVNVAAAVLSVGPPHLSQARAGSDEASNLVLDTRLVRIRPPNREDHQPCNDAVVGSPACHFDDIVDWVPTTVLQYHLVTAGRLP